MWIWRVRGGLTHELWAVFRGGAGDLFCPRAHLQLSNLIFLESLAFGSAIGGEIAGVGKKIHG